MRGWSGGIQGLPCAIYAQMPLFHIGKKVVEVRRSRCHLVLVMQVLSTACRYAYAFLAFELLSAVTVLLCGLAIVRRAPRIAAPQSKLWKDETENAGGSFHVQVAPAACTDLISRSCSLSQMLLQLQHVALCCLVGYISLPQTCSATLHTQMVKVLCLYPLQSGCGAGSPFFFKPPCSERQSSFRREPALI